jgi:3D (Asp-Asp-Asp) domain-containing protein
MRVRLILASTCFALVACGSSSSKGQPGLTDAGSPVDSAQSASDQSSPGHDGSHPVDASDAASGMDVAMASDGAAPEGASDAAASGEAGTPQTMEATFYGWDDNSPPGNAIAYPKSSGFPTVHDAAGGTGTYADPITFASDKSELPIGTLVYAAFIEKYLVMEDDCGGCVSDWSTSKSWHIDVWMNSDGSETASKLFDCEDQWTQSATTIEVNPPPGRMVTTAPLFDPSTNVCRTTP